ncbi:MAG: hypothetical protein AAGF12_01150 [Myxococcota bacterium]
MRVSIAPFGDSGWIGTLQIESAQRVLRNSDCTALSRALASSLATELSPPQSDPQEPVVPVPATGTGLTTELSPPQPDPQEPAISATETRTEEAPEVGLSITDHGPSTEQSPSIVVSVEGANDLTLHRVTRRSSAIGVAGGVHAVALGWEFEQLCGVPCEVSLEAGRHQFGVGRGTDIPLPVEDSIDLTRPTRLHASYTSKASQRTAGWLALLGGSIVGVSLIMVGLFAFESEDEFGISTSDPNLPMIVVGGVLTLAGNIAFYPLAFQRDSVSVTEISGR